MSCVCFSTLRAGGEAAEGEASCQPRAGARSRHRGATATASRCDRERLGETNSGEQSQEKDEAPGREKRKQIRCAEEKRQRFCRERAKPISTTVEHSLERAVAEQRGGDGNGREKKVRNRTPPSLTSVCALLPQSGAEKQGRRGNDNEKGRTCCARVASSVPGGLERGGGRETGGKQRKRRETADTLVRPFLGCSLSSFLPSLQKPKTRE